ncbi:alpha/beta-type small acid-soluble spore protein [Pseudalkalibacillus caeni]|nr:alpha/beta-type small acid-soluble spore protein [Pseudalkalibacillus caeni]
MANRNKILVPEARNELDQFKVNVMEKQGYQFHRDPDQIKYEVARESGVPLEKGYNGDLTSRQAGKVGGYIGGNMVKEMIKMAEQQLQKNRPWS